MSNFCKEGNLSVTLRWGGLCKHFCCGKAISIIYSECVFVELVIQHAVRMHLIVICDLSDSTISFQVTSWTARFRGDVTENKMLFWFSLQSVSDIFLSLIFFKWSQLGAHYFLIYLFKICICFGQLCVHHQENLLYLCNTGIFHSLWVAVWSAEKK